MDADTGRMAEFEEHRFPCNKCGSDLRYKPSADMLVCDHCGNRQEVLSAGPWKGNAIAELDFRAAIDARLPEAEIEETRVSRCPNCGAETEFDPETHAAECPFCATPVVTDTGLHRHIKPKAVLPFLLDEEEAREKLARWLGTLWFAPGGVAKFARKNRAMQGVYVPYWTFDADTTSQYRGQRGDVYHETRRVNVMVDGRMQSQNQTVAQIRWSPARGRVRRFFDDVLVLGSRSLPKRYTDGLAPWDLSALEPYRPEYLAGFRAEGYTVELQEGFQEAREVMNAMIVRDVRFDIGGDQQRIDDLKTEIGTLTFKHILLPVWLAVYRYRGKAYRIVINGRTGTVQGERPYSALKIATAIIIGVAVAIAIGYVAALNQ